MNADPSETGRKDITRFLNFGRRGSGCGRLGSLNIKPGMPASSTTQKKSKRPSTLTRFASPRLSLSQGSRGFKSCFLIIVFVFFTEKFLVAHRVHDILNPFGRA